MIIYNHLWHQSESAFYYDVISRLDFKQDYDYVLISKLYPYNVSYTDPWPKLKEGLIRRERPVIMFLCGDEYYSTGEEYFIEGITKIIFKQYAYYGYKDHPFIRPIPLSLIDSNRDFTKLPIIDRQYDYSFMGTCHLGRHQLRETLANKNDNWNKYVNFFHDWVDINNRIEQWNSYLNVLQNTKIALCPSGPRSNESFRMIEAARCGCIIVATGVIPHWYHESCPYIEVESWGDISVIDSVLSKTKKELQELSDQTYKWYQNCLSSQAIAKYVTLELGK